MAACYYLILSLMEIENPAVKEGTVYSEKSKPDLPKLKGSKSGVSKPFSPKARYRK